MSRLVSLDVGYNDLCRIPEDIEQLRSLKTLRIMNNFISSVPVQVCAMKRLKSIDVSSNPVTEPPIECCERGISAIRRYWQRQNVATLKTSKLLKSFERSAREKVTEVSSDSSEENCLDCGMAIDRYHRRFVHK